MKRVLSIFLVVMMCASLAFTSVATAATFKDVDETTAIGQAIQVLTGAGVLSGYGDGNFGPNDSLSRAQLCKVVNLIFKYTEKDTTGFSDVKPTAWYYDHVLIAKKAGYIKGYEDGTFRGDNKVTREQACVILARVAGLKDNGVKVEIADKVAEWALPSVKLVIAHQYMSLEAGNTFRATENITRGEFSQTHAVFVKGGSTPGGSMPGGSTPGGSTPGGSTPGGNTPGGLNPGGTTPTPTPTPTPPPANTYSVTFKNGETTVQTYSGLAAGSTLAGKIPANPTMSWGYEFTGWFNGGTEVTEATTVNGNMTVTAGRVAVAYMVTLMSEGSNVGGFSYTRDDSAPSLPTPSHSLGWGFEGWYTEEDGQGTKVTSLTLQSSTARERTLYAYWVDYETVNSDMVSKLYAIIGALDNNYDRFTVEQQYEVIDRIRRCLVDAIDKASSNVITKVFISNAYGGEDGDITLVKAYRQRMDDQTWSTFMTNMSYVNNDADGALMELKELFGLEMPE